LTTKAPTEPEKQDRGQKNEHGFDRELTEDHPIGPPKRRPPKSKPLLGKRRKECDAERVCRQRVEAAVREQAKAERDREARAVVAKHDARDEDRCNDGECERVRKRAMREWRRFRQAG
jgi:hypothetical protein